MAKLFSFASWNVEHFHGAPERSTRVVEHVSAKNPDIFALYEVEGKHVFEDLMARMPNHSFHITERQDKAHQEILVGVRRTLQCFVTQRDEFRSKVPTLRPGLMATLRVGGADYILLFLHLKSFADPRSWGLRDDMFAHVARLKRKLDKVTPGGKANMMCLGDFNTMGLNAPYNEVSDIGGDLEIESIGKRLGRAGMKRLSKTHEASWWNGSDNWEPSRLDHVFASRHINFRQFSGADVDVLGWPQEPTKAKQRKWIGDYSDHAMLYGEVQA